MTQFIHTIFTSGLVSLHRTFPSPPSLCRSFRHRLGGRLDPESSGIKLQYNIIIQSEIHWHVKRRVFETVVGFIVQSAIINASLCIGIIQDVLMTAGTMSNLQLD